MYRVSARSPQFLRHISSERSTDCVPASTLRRIQHLKHAPLFLTIIILILGTMETTRKKIGALCPRHTICERRKITKSMFVHEKCKKIYGSIRGIQDFQLQFYFTLTKH